jgi:N4-gp56 family major capsid protein
MASTTTSTGDNLLSQLFVKSALMTLESQAHLYNHAKKTSLTGGNGTTAYWNAFNVLDGASSTLTEGGSNTATVLSSRRVSATVAQYGRGVTVTDLSEYASVLDMIKGAKERLGYSATVTVERVCHTAIFKADYYTQNQSKTIILSAMMSGLASSFCANTGTNSNSDNQFAFPAVFGTSCARLSAVSKTAPSVSSRMSLKAIGKAVLRLEQKDAKPFADGLWIGYAHPNAIYVLKRDPSWKDWNQYMQTKETMYKNYEGTTNGVRWLKSNLCPRYAVTAHSVNISFIFGQEAYGVTEAMGGIEVFIVRGASKSDPYNTTTPLTYKFTGAAACLNPSAGVLLFTHELL